MSTEQGLPPGRIVERIPVPFAGAGSGEAELTWGQIGLWQSIALSGMSKTVFYTEKLAPGTTVEQVADEIAFMAGRQPLLS